MPERRMLLVEPADMLRRTVSLTARSLGMDAIAKTRFSFILGIILVCIIMLGIYKWSGIVAIVEPAFWLGQPRTQVGSFIDYFNSLIGWERFRASQFGIRHFCTIGLNPKEANNARLAQDAYGGILHDRVSGSGGAKSRHKLSPSARPAPPWRRASGPARASAW